MNYELEYRDGSNYKWRVTASLDKKLTVGDEITMEEIGETPQTFLPEYTGFNYDPDSDHNLLEVTAVLPEEYLVQIPICEV